MLSERASRSAPPRKSVLHAQSSKLPTTQHFRAAVAAHPQDSSWARPSAVPMRCRRHYARIRRTCSKSKNLSMPFRSSHSISAPQSPHTHRIPPLGNCAQNCQRCPVAAQVVRHQCPLAFNTGCPPHSHRAQRCPLAMVLNMLVAPAALFAAPAIVDVATCGLSTVSGALPFAQRGRFTLRVRH